MSTGTDLLSHIKEAIALEESDRRKVQIDCPLCGDILKVNTAGVRSCPMGHYRTVREAATG